MPTSAFQYLDYKEQALSISPHRFNAALEQVRKALYEKDFHKFVQAAWPIIEPSTAFHNNWHVEVICLPYATNIITDDGVKPIGDIVENTWNGNVLTVDHATNKLIWKPIVQWMKNPGKPLLTLHMDSGHEMEITDEHPVFVYGKGYVPAAQVQEGDEVACVQILSDSILSKSSKAARRILFDEMLWPLKNIAKYVLQRLRSHGPEILSRFIRKRPMPCLLPKKQKRERDNLSHKAVRSMPVTCLPIPRSNERLFQKVRCFLQCKVFRFVCSGWKQSSLHRWAAACGLSFDFLENKEAYKGKGRWKVLSLFSQWTIRRSSHRQKQTQQPDMELGSTLQEMPQPPKGRPEGNYHSFKSTVRSIKRSIQIPDHVYNINVVDTHNYFANGVLVHNCEHLEALTRREIQRCIFNVPPGFLKSVLVSVMWPVWHWIHFPGDRILSASFKQDLANRDAGRSKDILKSDWFQLLWGQQVAIRKGKDLTELYWNTKTGWRKAVNVGGGTGDRAQVRIVDDAHNIHEAESDTIREGVIDWIKDTWFQRGADIYRDLDVWIMQRTHARDACGFLMEEVGGYVEVVLPMEFEPNRCFVSVLENPKHPRDKRTQKGELLDPIRVPQAEVELRKRVLGAYRCTPFESPVLMADLSLKPIGEILVGDKVVGFTKKDREDVNGRMCLQESVVTEISTIIAPVVKITLDSGETIRCTPDHRWFRSCKEKGRDWYGPASKRSKLARVCPSSLPVLSKEDERLAGWLSGFFDGEGSITHSKRKGVGKYPPGTTIHIYQGAGRNLPLCEKLEYALKRFGFKFTYKEDQRKDNKTAACYGYRNYQILDSGLPVFQRFLHIVQPIKWKDRLIRGAYRAKFIKGRESIVRIDPDGEEIVYGLTTTTGNYVVWGLASSNSSGQLQQRPAPEEGGMFKKFWWRVWHYPGKPLPDYELVDANGTVHVLKCIPLPHSFDREVQSWDCTFEKGELNDYVAGQHWGKKDALSFLLDYVLAKMDFNTNVRQIKQMNAKFIQPGKILVERAANGWAIVSSLQSHIPGIVGVPTTKDSKPTRAQAYSPIVEAGQCILPHPSISPHTLSFIENMSVFPNGVHDDDTDAWSQGMNELYGKSKNLVPILTEFEENAHVSRNPVKPVQGLRAFRFWFGGVYPTCIIGQVTRKGGIIIFHCLQAEGMGMEEFIRMRVMSILNQDYPWILDWTDIGPPSMMMKTNDPVQLEYPGMVVERVLGTTFTMGHKDFSSRVQVSKEILRRLGGVLINCERTQGEVGHHLLMAIQSDYGFELDPVTQYVKRETPFMAIPGYAVGEALTTGLAHFYGEPNKPYQKPFDKKKMAKRAESYSVS